jgi:hypothetical protein
MVGSKVVNLFLEDAHPEIFADELHQVQLVFELGILAGQLLDQTISGVESDVLEIRQSLFFFRRSGRRFENVFDQFEMKEFEWQFFGCRVGV